MARWPREQRRRSRRIRGRGRIGPTEHLKVLGGAFGDGEVEAELEEEGIKEWHARRRRMAVGVLMSSNGDGGAGAVRVRVRRRERERE